MTYPADENGQREVVHYHYLPQKLLYSLTGDAAYVEAAQYDAAGRLTQRGLGARDAVGEPLLTQYQYAGWGADGNANDDYFDSQGRLLSITSGVENTPGLLQDLSYRYDIQGNITQITDANLGPQTQVFAYDALDRITAAQAVGGSVGQYAESYSYDPETGNLAGVTRDGIASAYQYDANHPHAVETVTGGQPRGFTYDANGSMTTRTIGADTFTLMYDGSLRMVAVQKNGATIAEFAYDGDGQMVVSSVGGTTTYTVGGYFELKITASGSTTVKYYSAGGTRVAMRQGDTVTYLFGDHLGSTSVAFDDVTNATQSQGYTAFGEQRYSLGGNLPTDYEYTGQKEFAEIGLHFYNARWYDGALGRFTQADTIIPQPGNPMAWDRFAYSLNNPVKYTDPTGHFTEDQLRQWYGDNWKEEIQQRYSEDIVVLLMSDDCNLGDVISYQNNGNDYTALFAEDEDGNLVMWDLASGNQTTFDSIASSITGFYEGDSSGHYTLAENYGGDGLPESFEILPSELFNHDQFVQQHYEITGIELPTLGGAASLVGGTIVSIKTMTPVGWFFTALGALDLLEVDEVYTVRGIPDISSYPTLPPSAVIPGTVYSKTTTQ